ncbi:MAG: ferrochelatase [Alphaproteobacteria bacterium CG11_big_fil_rev_8_21_14_0_20_39_49]|nr:MAG: ferrochelatase [Alphaproteobacteria bacterium CG11_big_fil_rev_8_21_14_0_20_39_49]
MQKKAVILFNLGGPDSLNAVKPFLFNLFNDKAIISVPNPMRFILAKLISSKREKTAQEIYSHMGGKSTIIPQTIAQKDALEAILNEGGGDAYKVFICMRYWHPFSHEVVTEVKNYNPDEIILLPLYPQFSTTTTASSVNDWNNNAKKAWLEVPTKTICCYPYEEKFIKSHLNLINDAIKRVKNKDSIRILFSAHGLPKKIIDKGDPYQWQVEQGAEKIAKKIEIDNLDWNVCYQSRVGPLEWIKPSTDEEIVRAGKEGKSVVLVPIAFVSEHSETLVELDIEYKKLADENNVKEYIRVPTLSVEKDFIRSLADICKNAPEDKKACSNEGKRICPDWFSKCFNKQ